MNSSNNIGKAGWLHELIKNDIEKGVYQKGDKLPSIRDLAKQYELSTNTVSNAIAMLINEGQAVARSGKGVFVDTDCTRSRMIGVMMFNFMESMRVESMILEELQKNLGPDYYLTLVNTAERYDVFCNGLESLISAGAAGLLIVPPKDDPKYISDIHRLQGLFDRVPTVFINRSIPNIRADTYSMDLKKGIENAFDYLYASGKRKTVIVLHDSVKFVQEETDAYNDFLDEHPDIRTDERYLIEWSKDIREIRMKLRGLNGDYDSLIAPDNVLVQLDDILAETGKSIPSELSLIGINDTILSRMHNPPLTSIVFPVAKIGKSAVQQLIKRIEGEKTNVVVRNFAPEFTIRKT